MHNNDYKFSFWILSFENSSSQISTEDIIYVTNGTQRLSIDDDESSLRQTESKTISMQQYKIFMQLTLQVKKMENTIRQMDEDIASKDSQIEQLRRANQCNERMCIATSHLSIVGPL